MIILDADPGVRFPGSALSHAEARLNRWFSESIARIRDAGTDGPGLLMHETGEAHRPSQLPYIAFGRERSHGDMIVHQLQQHMDLHLDEQSGSPTSRPRSG